MVQSEGTGFVDFTSETAISGTANISGNIIAISGEIAVSGTVSIITNANYRMQTILVTAASGGQALGSGLTTSGYTVQSITVCLPMVQASGIPSYNFYLNSGDITRVVYVGGYSGDAPYIGAGFPLTPGDCKVFGVEYLDYIYVVAGTSGTPISYTVEMK